MGKTLILYASKNGATKKCAEMLGEKLDGADIVDISREKPALSEYETVAIGSPVRMGRINKKISDFILKNIDVLKGKKVGIFICAGFEENAGKYFDANFPQALLNETAVKECFGGELDAEKMKGFDKFIVKMVAKANAQKGIKPPEIKADKIESFAEKLK